jgi:molybdenum storage protein
LIADLINEGSGERTHVQSLLMRESLMDRKVLAASDAQQVIPILPDVHVIHIGGASILDRGRDAIVTTCSIIYIGYVLLPYATKT